MRKTTLFLAGTALIAATAAFAAAPAQAAPMAPSTVTHPDSAALKNVAAGPEQFIRDMGQRGIGFLADPSMSAAQKKAEFEAILNDSFDMYTIGRFALGSYWNRATDAQKAEYQELFKDMIVRVYSRRFADYEGQEFEVRGARPSGKDALVTSYIVPDSGQNVKVDWRVREKDGRNKIVDVIIEGVSMAQTQRADFASVIQRGGGDIDVLLDHLRTE